MKLARMIGLGLVAAIAVMALIGASSAMAETTALCKVDEDPCAEANQVTEVHYKAEKIIILTSSMNYECDALLSGTVSKLGETQTLEAQSLTYTNCNQGCTRTVTKLGSFSIQRSALELAKISGSGFEISVKCGTTINCSYAFNELNGTVKGSLLTGDNGHITYEKATLQKLGGFLCPTEAYLDALFVASEPVYVKS